jgi:hypothetical protein
MDRFVQADPYLYPYNGDGRFDQESADALDYCR